MLVKLYGADPENLHELRGAPELNRAHDDAPYTRVSNGFSRKIENHLAAVSLNLLRLQFHQGPLDLARHPAMVAGVTSRLFDVLDLVNLLTESESKKAA